MDRALRFLAAKAFAAAKKSIGYACGIKKLLFWEGVGLPAANRNEFNGRAVALTNAN
jgi:hypothetical protein